MNLNPIWVIVFVLACTVVLWECVGGEFKHIERFLRWLKGSRIRYWIDPDGDFRKTGESTHPFEKEIEIITGLSIEITRGLFYKKSAIYNNIVTKNNIWVPFGISHYWVIAKGWRLGDGCDCVSLTDTRGLTVDTALRVINTYPSLQAMLDDLNQTKNDLNIAQGRLEKTLRDNEEIRKRWRFTQKSITELNETLGRERRLRQSLADGITVLLNTIEADRQKYKSEPAKNIRRCLESMLVHYGRFVNSLDDNLPEGTGAWGKEFHKVLGPVISKRY